MDRAWWATVHRAAESNRTEVTEHIGLFKAFPAPSFSPPQSQDRSLQESLFKYPPKLEPSFSVLGTWNWAKQYDRFFSPLSMKTFCLQSSTQGYRWLTPDPTGSPRSRSPGRQVERKTWVKSRYDGGGHGKEVEERFSGEFTIVLKNRKNSTRLLINSLSKSAKSS